MSWYVTRSSSVAPASESRPSAHQLAEQLRVVHHLVVAAELRVLVLQRVEAVRALRDDLLDAEAVERLDVLHRQHLEDVLVARTAGRVAGAQLARAEDGEVEARRAAAAWRRRGSSSCCGRRTSPRSRSSTGTRGRAVPNRPRRCRRPRARRPSRPARPGSCRRRSTSSPSSGTCCRARWGSRSPSGRGSGACRGSCRGSRC